MNTLGIRVYGYVRLMTDHLGWPDMLNEEA